MMQFALPLDWPAAQGEQDFIVSDSNRLAVRHLGHCSLWPVQATILTGPRKSGRSFLGRIFAARSGGRLIDNAESVDEESIFHAWNAAQATRRPLLLIADASPPLWQVALPDLASRLAATPQIVIGQPDDALMVALIEHLTMVRGLPVGPDVAEWIAHRIERSHVAVLRAVDALDAAAWSRKGRIGIAFVRDALKAAAVIEDSSE